jgi:hypothetical protein
VSVYRAVVRYLKIGSEDGSVQYIRAVTRISSLKENVRSSPLDASFLKPLKAR